MDDDWPNDYDICIDSNLDDFPEHDYGESECRRCGAEPED